MSRIKWNLDQLEEVKRQHDEYMKSTEEVINKGRSDLASMTEEVWEGEDADMAREQYDHLVYREMPDTWRQLDTCNESIQRALKQAYEAKNFCNDFPQIFKSGSMPSETDSSSCSGYFMCDEGNCNQLMSYMDAAGREAAELKRNIESVESILSSLETDEAKFDYASYTEPIKEQSQNVADYTRTYNIALERYVHKVDDLDRTLENKLLNATPLSVSQPFDPACIEFGEYIHFRKGDIVNSLEDHNHVDISYSFEVSEVERILEMLFDKENLDISGLSEKDFEIAFLKLSKEKQRAMLHDMGLSNAQIDSILATEQSRRAFANTVFKSGAMDKIRKMDSKMPQYNNFGKPKDKTGGSKEKAPIPSAQSSSGVVECDSSSIYTPYKLDPSSYESLYNDYAEAANMLCDDDPSNDADAIALMNEALQKGFYFQERDGVNYIMYDTDLLQYCIDNAEEGSLLYLLFDDFRNKIGDGTLSTYEGHAWSKEHSLEISQLGAGYQLVLNVDSKFGFWSQEIKDKRVAYAATKETARNYFIKDGELDYSAIEEWFKLDGIDCDSVEFVFLANEMTKLDDADVFTILNMGEYCSYHNFMYPEADGYDVSKQLSILAMSYYIQSQVMQMTLGSEYDDNYSRAVAFMAAADYMCTVGAGCNHYIFYNTKEHSNGKKIYNLNLSVDKSYAPESSWFYDRKITIYPFGDPKANDSYLKDAANGNISTFQTSIIRKMGKDALDKSVGFILDELNIGGVVQFDTALYISELMNTYHQNVLAQGSSQALDYGDAVEAMRISGTVVHVGEFGSDYGYVESPDFNDIELLTAVEMYNYENETNYTIDDMKTEFNAQSDVFNAYVTWYNTDGGDSKRQELFTNLVDDIGKEKLYDMSIEELKDYIDKHIEDYFDEG